MTEHQLYEFLLLLSENRNTQTKSVALVPDRQLRKYKIM